MPMSKVYRWPLILALVIAVGLTAALTGDGFERVISWIALALPIGVVVACVAPALWRRQEREEPRAATRFKAVQQ